MGCPSRPRCDQRRKAGADRAFDNAGARFIRPTASTSPSRPARDGSRSKNTSRTGPALQTEPLFDAIPCRPRPRPYRCLVARRPVVASGHADGRLRLSVLDFTKPHCAVKVSDTIRVDHEAVHSAAFTPDSKHVLVIDPDQTLRLYDVDSRREVRRFVGHTARVTDVAVSRTGGVASARRRQDPAPVGPGDRQGAAPPGSYRPASTAWPSVPTACACPAAATRVRLWDLTTGQELHRFDGHEGAVVCVAVSPDGQYALSGGSDHTARLWPARPLAAPGQ